MTVQTFPSQILHSSGVRAELSVDRDGECLLEITQVEPAAGHWQLVVLWHPVDERGLARGFGSQLFQTPLAFATRGHKHPRAYVRLPPNISFDLARKCHFRVETCPSPWAALRSALG